MSPDQAGQFIESKILVTREDIARAKAWISKLKNGNADTNAANWVKEHKLEEPKGVDTESPRVEQVLSDIARAYSLRKAFYTALFELSGAGEIVFTGEVSRWEASLGYRTQRGAGPIELKVSSPAPSRFERMTPLDGITTDPDIFLDGVNCKKLHPGIHEAIVQSLDCFRNGLYMPATAMLAAATEATWTECGTAVATKLGIAALENLFADSYASISRKVADLSTALDQQNGRALLKSAGLSIAKVREAEVWTGVLRDRRNALHWTKAKSFIADHSETATLLIAAPLHIGTLEAIRLC